MMDNPIFPALKKMNQIRETNSLIEKRAGALPEVELIQEGNRILDRYRELYKERYGVDAVLANIGVANTITKDLIRKVGMQRAQALMEHYMKLNGDNDWYVRNGHSLRTFQSKIEEVNASLGLHKKMQAPTVSGYNPMVVFNTQCTNCKSWHDITCRANELEKHGCATECANCRE